MLKYLDEVKRTIMGSFTCHIGKNAEFDLLQKEKLLIKKVLIVRPNHRLGNQLLTMPLVEEVASTFSNCKIDLFLKGNLGPVLFKNFDCVDRIITLPKKHFNNLGSYLGSWLRLKARRYDLVINVVSTSSSGRIAVRFSRGRYKLFGDGNKEMVYKKNEHIAKAPIYALRKCLQKLAHDQASAIPTLNLALCKNELYAGQKMLEELVPQGRKTISLFTYATGSKCYSKSWWMEFYRLLKLKFPDVNILEILPVERVSQIDFKEAFLYSTDIREMASVIANTDIFIGADSGIMHLASAARVPTIGLFSRANCAKYEPYNFQSIGITTNNCTNDQILEHVERILLGK